MAMDPVWIWIALGVIGALVLVMLIARTSRHSRSTQLRDQFGQEYDHVVRERGSRTKAERELLARAEEAKQFEIRPLSASEREQYRREWERVEKHFVERPAMAVVEADELVAVIMRAQGYPIGDFDKHAAHLSVHHPRVVEHYRAGHEVIDAAPGSASTEDLRQAMLHYRALFDELVGNAASDVARDIPRANEVAAPSPRASDFFSEEERPRQ
jgi:hypothetical protein